MKTLIASIMLAVSVASQAAPKYIPTEESLGIVTPEVAEGMFRTSRIAHTKEGLLVVCRMSDSRNYVTDACSDSKGNSAWRSLPNSVPAGKKYIGFKSVSGEYGDHNIEVYWK